MTQKEILLKLTEDIRLRGLTEHTVDEYHLRAKAFLQYFDKSVKQLSEVEIRIFLKYLLEGRKLSPASVNGYNSALRFLFEVTLERNLNYKRIPRAKEPILLPNVMAVPEIEAFFSVIEKSRDRAIFLNIYGLFLHCSL